MLRLISIQNTLKETRTIFSTGTLMSLSPPHKKRGDAIRTNKVTVLLMSIAIGDDTAEHSTTHDL